VTQPDATAVSFLHDATAASILHDDPDHKTSDLIEVPESDLKPKKEPSDVLDTNIDGGEGTETL